MILPVKPYAAYLVIPGDQSSISGHYYLSNHTNNLTNSSDIQPNGHIITKYNSLQYVVISTVESETGGILVND